MKFVPSFLVVAQCLLFVLGQEYICTDQITVVQTIVQTVTQTINSGNPTVGPWSNNNNNGPAPVTITAHPVTVTVTQTISPIVITQTISQPVITETITLTSVETSTPPWTSSRSNSTYHWKSSSSQSKSLTSILQSTTSAVSINSTATGSSASITSTTSGVSSSATPSSCHDSCASSVDANPTLCSSLFLTTISPPPVTNTLYTTAYPLNTTRSSVVSTETDVETIFSTYTKIVTTSTTYSNKVVLTTTITDETVSQFTTTGTVTVTTTSNGLFPKRSLDSNVSASACSNSDQLSSACSCAGATHGTTVLPVQTVTVTSVMNGTFTFAKNLTTTTQTETSETVTATSDVGYLTISDVTSTLDVTATTTIGVVATSTATADAQSYCENGSLVDGTIAPCGTDPCTIFNLRIEGATDTIYEGPIMTGPQNVTTPSGGTHLCNGQNNNANPAPGGTGITAIASAGGLCGFDFDGTFSSSFDDFFIERIGSTAQTANEFWGILVNFAFTPTGGCETEPGNGNSLLWAFNAFNANYFLEVSPQQATLSVGQTAQFQVFGHDGNGGTSGISGAAFGDQTSNSGGVVTFTATVPGNYRLKATRSDSIRSNQVLIRVNA